MKERLTGPPTTAATSTINTIGALIAKLAPNPDAYGDRGSNLLNRLRDLEERSQYPDSSSRVIGRAGDLIDDVQSGWVRVASTPPSAPTRSDCCSRLPGDSRRELNRATR